MKILMICTAFAPENEIGCIRTSKLAKYLVRAGHDLTVISPTIIEGMNTSDDLLCAELERINHIHVPYSYFFQKIFFRKRNDLTKSGAKNKMRQQKTGIKAMAFKVAEKVYTEYRNRNWEAQVRAYMKNHAFEKYDLVLSSYPSICTHWLAEYVRNKGIAQLWLADFRDPIVLESSTGAEKNRLIKQQRGIVKNADIVTHVSKAGCEKFVCNPEDKSKIKWLPNGFDEDDFDFIHVAEEVHGSDCLVLSYAGGLYGGERDCSPLFKAISELIKEEKIETGSTRIDYAGKDGSIIKKQAGSYGVENLINDVGQISRDKSIHMQSQSDCVIVATTCYVDNGGAMTGKIYEPVMMRKPILMMVSGLGKNSEPGAFVKDLYAGFVYEESVRAGDVSVIKGALLEMIAEKKETGHVTSKIDDAKRNQYSYSEIIKELERIIRGENR